MALPFQPWRAALLPASYNGAEFHVEVGGQAGGRRNAVHEWPKAPDASPGFPEDMGRKLRRWTITGYVIGPIYTFDRDALIAACEIQGPGVLIHPTLGFLNVNLDVYSTSESRERGGICTFEMTFVEAGSIASGVTTDTQSAASGAGNSLGAASSTSLDSSLHNSAASGAGVGGGGSTAAGSGGSAAT